MNSLLDTFVKSFGLAQKHAPFDFYGGVSLPPSKRALTGSVTELALPPTLCLPLINYAQQPVIPVVKKGESVLRGQLLAPGIVAPSSGLIAKIEARETIHPGAVLVDSLILDCDGHDKSLVQEDGSTAQARLNAITESLHDDSSADTNKALNLLNQFALNGLGGAGFPTAEKLVSAVNQGVQTLIINAAECEPEIACDEALMQSEPDDIAKGIASAIRLTQCKHCIFAIEDSKPVALKAMRNAIHEKTHGMDSTIDIMVIPTLYPTGAESPLIHCVTGQFIPHNEKPTDHGILCINVATVHALWQALNAQALDSRIISLGGRAMPNPCNVRVRFGTSVLYLLQQTNNALNIEHNRIRAGGPLSGFDLSNLSVPVGAKTNCLLAEPNTREEITQPCIRCGLCADVCPAKLLPQQLHWYAMAQDTNKCTQLKLDACIECGCCDLVCPSSIKLTETFRYAKSQTKLKQTQDQAAADSQKRFEERENRLQQREADRSAAIEKRKQSIKANRQPDADQISDALARIRSKAKQKK